MRERSPGAAGWELVEGEVPLGRAPLLFATGLVRHAFTTRRGGVSQGPFRWLNLGWHVGDDPAAVRENRRRLLQALDLAPEKLITAHQVHGTAVGVAEEGVVGRREGPAGENFAGVDALITAQPGLVLAVFVADCLPILLLDPRRKVVAAVHAGWRGTAGRAVVRAVEAMQKHFAVEAGDCLAALGPAIGPCCYQVGDEVAAEFRRTYAGWRDFLRPAQGGGWRLDLWEANRQALQEIGVVDSNLSLSQMCTACHPELFYSHRRDGGRTGRMAALIGLV
ncbi:MAG: peptidoglycan editing factor PgeF [Bacillota bacterium]|nr:peptidoglycan editing factor PgeF [Bacillota bacterium]